MLLDIRLCCAGADEDGRGARAGGGAPRLHGDLPAADAERNRWRGVRGIAAHCTYARMRRAEGFGGSALSCVCWHATLNYSKYLQSRVLLRATCRVQKPRQPHRSFALYREALTQAGCGLRGARGTRLLRGTAPCLLTCFKLQVSRRR